MSDHRRHREREHEELPLERDAIQEDKMFERADNDNGETRTCIACNQVFRITPAERDFYLGKDLALPRRCKDCRRIKRSQGLVTDTSPVVEERVCVDCSATFTVTENEMAWLKARGFFASSRCRSCRARRNQEREQLQSANAQAEVARVWRD